MSGLADRDRRERGELQGSWRDVEQLLGVGRDTVLRRAWDALAEQNPGASRAVLSAIMAAEGVAFSAPDWGYRVTIAQRGRRWRAWLRPLKRAGLPAAAG